MTAKIVKDSGMAKINMSNVAFYKEKKVTDADMDKISKSDVVFIRKGMLLKLI